MTTAISEHATRRHGKHKTASYASFLSKSRSCPQFGTVKVEQPHPNLDMRGYSYADCRKQGRTTYDTQDTQTGQEADPLADA